jgi:hypothetical protein
MPGPDISVSGAHGVFPTRGMLMIFPRLDVNFPENEKFAA